MPTQHKEEGELLKCGSVPFHWITLDSGSLSHSDVLIKWQFRNLARIDRVVMQTSDYGPGCFPWRKQLRTSKNSLFDSRVPGKLLGIFLGCLFRIWDPVFFFVWRKDVWKARKLMLRCEMTFPKQSNRLNEMADQRRLERRKKRWQQTRRSCLQTKMLEFGEWRMLRREVDEVVNTKINRGWNWRFKIWLYQIYKNASQI